MTEKSRGTVAYTRHKIYSVSHMESESWYRVDMVTWWQQAHKDKVRPFSIPNNIYFFENKRSNFLLPKSWSILERGFMPNVLG